MDVCYFVFPISINQMSLPAGSITTLASLELFQDPFFPHAAISTGTALTLTHRITAKCQRCIYIFDT